MIAPAVKRYLSAVNAAAIYVSVFQEKPKSVGCARDPDRVLEHVRDVIGIPVTFGWLAWAPDYEALVAIAKMPDLMVKQRQDGVKVSRTLPELVQVIESCADRSAIVLTPHKIVVQRAAALAEYVDSIFSELRTNGQMAAFNTAYKIYRATASQRGQKVMPFWKAEEMLRRVTIRALVSTSSRSAAQEKLGELIVEQFPWFKQNALDSYRERA
jgi:hypothetical protein